MRCRGTNVAILAALAWLTFGCASAGEDRGAAVESSGTAESAMTEDTLGHISKEPPEEGTWALIEFAREVRDEDLQWLKRNGFEVDTVVGRTVRGVLKDPKGAEAIVKDARVAAVEALMR